MDSKTMFIGGVVIGVGILSYYAYDSYQKSKALPSYGQSAVSSYNLTAQKGIPTQFSTALDTPLYSNPPASQDDVVKAGLPPAVATGVDAICGINSGAGFLAYADSLGKSVRDPDAVNRFLTDPEWANSQISMFKTHSGCFPTM